MYIQHVCGYCINFPLETNMSGHLRYLRELLVLQVLCDSRVKVLCITFIQAVNLPSFLHLHIPLDQYELPDCLKSKKQ